MHSRRHVLLRTEGEGLFRLPRGDREGLSRFRQDARAVYPPGSREEHSDLSGQGIQEGLDDDSQAKARATFQGRLGEIHWRTLEKTTSARSSL